MDSKYDIPDHFSMRSRELWLGWVGTRVKSAGRVESLRNGLELRDRANSCREVINREGVWVVSKRSGLSHPHPLLKEEINCRKLFAKILHQLNLEWEFLEDGVDPYKP
jgi:hypothetical protein